MSAASSPESEGSTSDSSEQATGSCSSASGTSGDDGCSQPGSPESPATRTYETLAWMPYRTLEKDGTVTQGYAQRDVVDALHGPTGNKEPLISFAEGPKKYQPLKKLTGEQVGQSIWLYREGLSLADVAAVMGVSRQAMHDLLKRRIQLRDRIEALPRKDQTAVRRKRARTLKRYRERAARITRAQIRRVQERDTVCQMCGREGEEIDHVIPVALGGQTELWNLQLLCRPCHVTKTRTDKRMIREGVTPSEAFRRSTFSAVASRDRAKTSASPADEPDSSTENDPASSSSSHESLTFWSDLEAGFSLRTYPDFFPQTVDEISPLFSRRWPSSGFTTSLGECWTADTSECPSADAACSSSLADVLEETAPARYFLSPRAAAGILRRAERRGRELPSHLYRALEQVARTTTTDRQAG